MEDTQPFEEELRQTARDLGYAASNQTRYVLLVGENLASSRFFRIFSHAFSLAGLDIVYLSCETKAPELGARIGQIRRSSLILGFTVTTPHKTEVLRYLDRIDDRANAARAVNSVWKDPTGALCGTTFDGEGWVYWYRKYKGAGLDTERILLLGAGGAARAVTEAVCRHSNDASVGIFDICPERAEILVGDIRSHNPSALVEHVERKALSDYLRSADIVGNFTGLGKAKKEELPDIDYALLCGKHAVDANYQPYPTTAFLSAAKSAGASVSNGLGFLIGTIPPFFQKLSGKTTDFDALLKYAKSELGLREAE